MSGRQRAADWFHTSAERAPRFAAWGHELLRAGSTEQAAAALECAVRGAPDNASYHALFGAALQRLGKGEDAKAQYERAVALGADDVQLWANLGELRLELLDRQGALEAFQHALALAPNTPHPAKARIAKLVDDLLKGTLR